MALSDAKQCKAKAKSTGNQCKNPAVTGWDVCRLHGARGGRPIIHGIYSNVPAKVRDKLDIIEQHDPTSLFEELALQRALFSNFVEETLHDHVKLNAQHLDYVMRFADAIGRTVDRIVKMQNETALTAHEIKFLQARTVDLVTKYISDPDKQRQFIAELFGISENRERDTLVIGAEATNKPG